MGTQNPRFFPLMGTVPSAKHCWAPGSCPSVKILSKSVGHGSLGDLQSIYIRVQKPQNQSQQPLASSLLELHKSSFMFIILISSKPSSRLKWVCAAPVNNRLSVLNVFPIAHI